MRWTGLLLAVSVAVLACESATEPEGFAQPAIWTDRPVYVVESGGTGWQAEIPYTFFNLTGETVQVAHCGGAMALRLDRWHDGAWVPAWFPILPLCLSVPIDIAPGEAFPDTLHFYADYGWASDNPDLATGRIDGAYRIVWLAVSYAEEGRDEIPLEYRASNVFTLRD